MKVLNLYAGIGGNRKLWPDDKIEVTAVELNPEIAKKVKMLNNMVEPKTGLHVFNCAFKERQGTLDGLE